MDGVVSTTKKSDMMYMYVYLVNCIAFSSHQRTSART